jgi:hypothetical protein
MSTTATMLANPATGSVQLSITPSGTITRVQRTDANGTYDVRLLAGILPWPAASGVLTLDDYEAANGSCTYTITTSVDSASGAVVLDLGGPWLGVPVTPQFSSRVDSITGYGSALESRSTVLEPEGSPFPIVITRTGSSRRGRLELWAGTYPAALNLLRLAGRGQVMMLRQSEHAGMDMFFTVNGGTTLKTLTVAQGKTVFAVDLDYIEVPRPAAPLSGALGWTWGQLKNTYATWGDVFNDYATWGDVRTNRTL